jgi:Fic family protein
VPSALPPDPALPFDGDLHQTLEATALALGRLDGVSTLLPDKSLVLYSFVRKEAVLSSQIEGSLSSLSDLLLFELDEAPGCRSTTSWRCRTLRATDQNGHSASAFAAITIDTTP